ncbi:MAG: ATP synthase F1 subunit epsilon [Acidimicrobiia bacterium]
MATLHAELVSPEQILWSGDAEMVVCRTQGGDIAFLPGHQPYLGALAVGVVRFLLEDKSEVVAAVHGGFVQVGENEVRVLSDLAELGGDIDVTRAQSARERAEATLMKGDDALATAALARATVRIEANALVTQLARH